MEQKIAVDPIEQLRVQHRAEIVAFRKEDRNARFKQHRLSLQKVEELVADISLEEFKQLVLQLKEKKASFDTLKAIKNNCCTPTRAEAFFRIDGAFDALISIFVGKDANKQLEATACLTNLACSSHKAAQRIIKKAGPYLVCFISSGNCYLQDQSAWAAGNLADDCFDCFSLLKAQGLLPPLFALLKSPSSEVIQSAIHALHACTKYGDGNLGSIIFEDRQNLKKLLSLFEQNAIEKVILQKAAFTLSNIFYLAASQHFKVSNDEVQVILNSLIKSVSNLPFDVTIALPMIRCLGFLSTSCEICYFLNNDPMFHFCSKQIFNCELDYLKVELLWVFTNIAVSGMVFPGAININSMLKILDTSLCFLDCSSAQVLYCLSTLATNNEEIKEILQQEDIFQKILSFLNCGEKILQQGAKILINVLKKHKSL